MPADQVYLVAHQCSRIALSQMIGVGAHGADFCKLFYVEALAGHGYQFFLVKDSEVVPKINGSGTKGAGVGQRGEEHHLLHMLFGQGVRSKWFRTAGVFVFKNQLQSWYFVEQVPACGLADLLRRGVKDGAAGRKQLVEFFKPAGVSLFKTSKGRNPFVKEFYFPASKTQVPVA